MKHISLIIVMLVLFTIVNAQDGWFWQNPKPFGNLQYDIFAFDENTAITVGQYGTIMKTTDGGTTWNLKESGITTSLFYVHFTDGNTGWAVGDLGVILKTSDGGEAWSVQRSTSTGYISDINFISENMGWVIDNSSYSDMFGDHYDFKILKTEDGGTSWEIISTDTTNWLYSIFFADSMNGWMVGSYSTILRTNDGGYNWISQSGGTSEPLYTVFFIDSLTGWIGGNHGTILSTTDGGNNWESQTSGTYWDLKNIYFFNRNTGWAMGKFGANLKTTNGGQAWVSQNNEITGHIYSVSFVDENTFWFTGWEHPVSEYPERFYIFRTTDAGINWSLLTSGMRQNLSSVFFADRNNGWAVGNNRDPLGEGILVKTTDGGETWMEPIPTGIKKSFSCVFFVDENTGWVVGNHGTIIKSTDGGWGWTSQISGTSAPLTSVYFVNDTTGWAVGSGGWGNIPILKTTDGENWILQTNYNVNNSLSSVYFLDTQTGWIAGSNGIILKSTDGGANWTRLTSGTTEQLSEIRFIDNNTGWVVGSKGTILKTTDGGNNWISQESNTTTFLCHVCFINKYVGWVVGSGGTILNTIDGGETWASQQSGTGRDLTSVYFVDGNTGWVVGEKGTILKTIYGGIVVEPTNSPPNFTEDSTAMIRNMLVDMLYIDTLRATDGDADKLTFIFINSPQNMSLVDSVIVWIPKTSGNSKICVQVSDYRGGYDTLSWSISVNSPPSFFQGTSDIVDTINIKKEYRDTLHAVDHDGDTLSFVFLDSADGMALSDSILIWTPTINDTGIIQISVIISDGKEGRDTLNWSIFVNSPPFFTDSSSETCDSVAVGAQYRDTLHAVDPNGDRISFSFIACIPNMSLSDSIISCHPTIMDTGKKTIIAEITDGNGVYDTLSWSIYVYDDTVHEQGEEKKEKKCGCGSGTILALIPAFWARFRKKQRNIS